MDIWNLRGYCAGYDKIFPLIETRIADDPYDLIIIDPIYKLYGDSDENSAKDVAKLFNAVESLAVKSGALLAYGAHFAKGDSSKKAAIDRGSGSGVFARDPDTLITFTPHNKAGCYTVEAILRNLAPVIPFVVHWKYPVWQKDDQLDPEDVGKSTALYSAELLLGSLNGKMTAHQWQEAVGCSVNTFKKYRNDLIDKKLVGFDHDSKTYFSLKGC